MSIENTANNNNQPSADRAYREQWIRTLIAEPTATAGEKLVGTALAWRMNMDANNPWHRAAWPKAGTLCQEVAMTEGSTQNALKALWEKGWLKRIGKCDNGRGSWVYRFIYPEGVTPFGTQSPLSNGVHYPVESIIQWSQSPLSNGVRVHQPVESESIIRLTESLNDPLNESLNESPQEQFDSFHSFPSFDDTPPEQDHEKRNRLTAGQGQESNPQSPLYLTSWSQEERDNLNIPEGIRPFDPGYGDYLDKLQQHYPK